VLTYRCVPKWESSNPSKRWAHDGATVAKFLPQFLMLKTKTADKCLCERQSDAQKAEGTSCPRRPEGIALADRLPLQASVAGRGG